jgi:hypothetical protein
MDRPLKETVYSPDSELLSFGKQLRNMGSELTGARVREAGGGATWPLDVRLISCALSAGTRSRGNFSTLGRDQDIHP